MLVISRKKNESLVIANDIVVTVVEIRGDKVRLGIVHPKEIPVHRQEVYDAIRRIDPPSTPAPTAASPVTFSPPVPSLAQHQPDKLDRLAAALASRLGIPVSREQVLQALREAGMESAVAPVRS